MSIEQTMAIWGRERGAAADRALSHWLGAVSFETARGLAKRAARTRQPPVFLAEGLERRLFLSTAIAAFGLPHTFAAGAEPNSVALADVNGDGKLDLVAANLDSNTVSVLLGNGNGTFQAQRTFATGRFPEDVTVADVNGDGEPDLIVANNTDSTVSVLLGNGNGTFQAQRTFATGPQSGPMLAADVNGDGKVDLIVPNFGTNTISVLLGNGNGTFQAPLTTATPHYDAIYTLAVADINGDGKPDLIGGSGAHEVAILLGNGNGTFQPQQNILTPYPSFPDAIIAADVNGDGKPDIVFGYTVRGQNTGIAVLLGNGNGTFKPQQSFSTSLGLAAIADVNVDGKPDLVVAGSTGNGIYLGNGNGTFQAVATFAAGTGLEARAVGDINDDGRPDVVSLGSGNVSVVLGDVPPVVSSIVRTTPPGPTTTGNMNYTVTFNEPVTGVSLSDFFVVSTVGNGTYSASVSGVNAIYNVNVRVPPGSGSVTLTLLDNGDIKDALGNPLQPGGAALNDAGLLTAGSYARSIAVGDVNGDGKPDLIVPTYYLLGLQRRSGATVLLGTGSGTFQNAGIALINPGFQSPTPKVHSLALADVNGDGKLDLLATLGYGVLKNGTVAVLLGNGNGTFQSPRTFATGFNPYGITVADVNGDGKPDLLIANEQGSSVSVLLGNGNGTFQPQLTIAVGSPPPSIPLSIAIADLNRDGKPDLVVNNYAGNSVSVLLGNGNGTFQTQKTFATGKDSSSVAVADLNGDGIPDLAVTNFGNSAGNGGGVSVLLGNGDGTFGPQQTFAAGLGPFALSIADVSGDGKPDLVVTNVVSGTVSILLGNGDGTFGPQQTFATGGEVWDTVVSDLNGDGRLDLAVVNYGQTGKNAYSTVSVLLGNSDGSFTGQTYTVIPPTVVTSIDRSNPSTFMTSSSTVSFAVDFSGTVSNVVPSEFQVITTGSVATALPVVVTGSGSSYTVTVTHVHGSGTLQLALVDHDAIVDSLGTPLGGFGPSNGSFTGQSYWIEQTAPSVVSINRTTSSPVTSANSVTYAVSFSTNVTGVAAGDFQVVTTGSVSWSNPLVVGGSGSSYTVTINGIIGAGTLGLNLADNGQIRDNAGNPLQTSTPSFSAAQSFATNSGASIIAAGDLNGDGIPDLVAANFEINELSILMGNGNGTFAPPQTLSAPNTDYVQIADINGDGHPDLIASAGSGVGVFLANGNGTFQAEQTFASGGQPAFGQLVVADLNNDGKPDVVVLNESQESVAILLGNGNGTFLPTLTYAAASTINDLGSGLAVADVNGDGRPDLIVPNYNSNVVGVFLGNGNGTFLPRLTFATGRGPHIAAQILDLNGDGNPDLVVANAYDNTVGVLLGNGNGTFQAQQTYASLSGPLAASFSDVNGDGNLDLVVANSGAPGELGVLLGNGNGTFQSEQQFLISSSAPRSLVMADVNLDGRADAITGNGFSSLSVQTNTDTDNFTGQIYTITIPSLDTINGTSGVDQISIYQDPDHAHIDWTLNGTSDGQLTITDPNGLTITGNGSNDVITLLYTNDNPLPNTLHLNGTFTINGLAVTNPLAGTTLEIGRSTVFVSYSSDPIASIQGYLKNGYNSGAWNGTPTTSTGVITSAAAAGNANHTTGIGSADFADRQGVNTMANTIELTYTLYGDANLDHQVNSADLQILLFNLNRPGVWDQGDFNYDAQVNSADLQNLLFTLNTSLGSQATPLAVAAAPVALAPASAPSSGSDPSSRLMPAINTTGSTTKPIHHSHAKTVARKRR